MPDQSRELVSDSLITRPEKRSYFNVVAAGFERADACLRGQRRHHVGPGDAGREFRFRRGIERGEFETGYSLLSDNSTQHAFLYTPVNGMVDLRSRIASTSG